MHHFKAFDMINLQYEIKVWKKILNKATNDKNQHPPPLFSTLRLLLFGYNLWYSSLTNEISLSQHHFKYKITYYTTIHTIGTLHWNYTDKFPDSGTKTFKNHIFHHINNCSSARKYLHKEAGRGTYVRRENLVLFRYRGNVIWINSCFQGKKKNEYRENKNNRREETSMIF